MNGRPPSAGASGGDLIEGLCGTLLRIRPDADIELIRRAREVAAHLHEGQRRQDGDPYITHPVTVATIMVPLGADDQTLCAAILHDTIEDTPYTLGALSLDPPVK